MSGVFLSYRRETGAAHAGRLRDRIVDVFGREKLFMDLDRIPAGTDWIDEIENALQTCDVMVVLIDKQWIHATDTDGQRRLDDKDDFVRREVSRALERGVPVIPVLVQAASMPTASELPDVLARLSRRQALRIDDDRWDYDSELLVRVLRDHLSSRASSRLRRTLLVLLPVVTAGVTIVATSVTLPFHIREILFWIAIPAMLALVYLFWRTPRRRRRWTGRATFVAGVVATSMIAIWGYVGVSLYQVKPFSPGTTGVYVARFQGDYRDYHQDAVEQGLSRSVQSYVIEERLEVRLLPRRIKTSDEAEASARQGNATAVLWGTAGRQLEEHLTVIDRPGVHTSMSVIGGTFGLGRDFNSFGLPSDLTRLHDGLALFLAGFASYQSGASSPAHYKDAATWFAKANDALESTTAQNEQHTPERALVGSIHFFLGNIAFFDRDKTRAESEYRISMKMTTHITGEPLFLEPVNNLGFLLWQQRGRLDEATIVLDLGVKECQESMHFVCVALRYNLARALNRNQRYVEALAVLSRALPEDESTEKELGEDNVDRTLVAFLHQERAYSHVKVCETKPGPDNDENYRLASSDLDRVQSMLSLVPDEPAEQLRNHSALTRSRINVGRARWSEAVRLLEEVEPRLIGVERASANLLLAIAYDCTGKAELADEHFDQYFGASKTGAISQAEWKEGSDYEKRVTTTCKVP